MADWMQWLGCASHILDQWCVIIIHVYACLQVDAVNLLVQNKFHGWLSVNGLDVTLDIPNQWCVIVRTEIQWTSFFFFKMSLMIKFWTRILHIHIIKHRLIYNCIFEYLYHRYEVYRGYIVFAFSVIMFVCLFVCLSVNFFFSSKIFIPPVRSI